MYLLLDGLLVTTQKAPASVGTVQTHEEGDAKESERFFQRSDAAAASAQHQQWSLPVLVSPGRDGVIVRNKYKSTRKEAPRRKASGDNLAQQQRGHT